MTSRGALAALAAALLLHAALCRPQGPLDGDLTLALPTLGPEASSESAPPVPASASVPALPTDPTPVPVAGASPAPPAPEAPSGPVAPVIPPFPVDEPVPDPDPASKVFHAGSIGLGHTFVSLGGEHAQPTEYHHTSKNSSSSTSSTYSTTSTVANGERHTETRNSSSSHTEDSQSEDTVVSTATAPTILDDSGEVEMVGPGERAERTEKVAATKREQRAERLYGVCGICDELEGSELNRPENIQVKEFISRWCTQTYGESTLETWSTGISSQNWNENEGVQTETLSQTTTHTNTGTTEGVSSVATTHETSDQVTASATAAHAAS
ncbi:alanine and proline-rich secreted protein Apa-like, partial [Frankliniella occidentalis]|uniref:Alanine and proline-rich secreted protein Apa-like n=1 Tax=Frankliniella occidentalis TaxID=133901 RepID=A0A9C6XW83_FRAOC